ncbi:hypothetical protein [Parahaliea mediterranea]|uniref:SMP-30/Gluconolactonase/LRE-like region domain-containing protein n=1 Tax=Parahaliea mediterranea TaxID=651086 RepID=A0A939DIV1_9GAMM|nr:hypothetical protein [Parahaliea mediterranea]MBN7798267.1 hypothetical protein [Parahaliea mediterranea]
MIKAINGVWVAVLLTLGSGPASVAADPAPAAPGCEPRDGIESICGLRAPEDIVLAPDGRHLIFGQMAAPGGLFLLDTRDRSTAPLAAPASDPRGGERWGDPACTAPPATLLAHGIDLRRRGDGRWQLLVVNHGGRESVEFYELLGAAQGFRAAWRGCAEAPADASLNDVAGLPGGGFLVTRMTSRESPMWELFLAVLGFDNGLVYRWGREEGFAGLPGTEGRFPNGIALAADGRSFFVNMYLGNRMRQFSLPDAEPLGEVAISKPDNVTLGADGKLLVASHFGSLLQLNDSLTQDPSLPSLLPYAIVEVDPRSLAKRQLFRHEGPPMGAGTAAVRHDGALYVGSYVGDRIVRVPLAADR